MTAADWRARDDFLPPGERPDLDNCEREAVHLTPAVQPVGFALVVDHETVIAASTNASAILGVDEVLGQTIAHLLGTTAATVRAGDLPIQVTIGDTDLELRAHRSRTGPVVVEACVVEHVDVDVAAVIGGVVGHIRTASRLDDLLHSAAESVRETLGFDRVWVYRFDRDFNGHIVAESCAGDLDSFLGLRFGEGDIPAQARALFLENRVRIVRDATRDGVPIEPSPLPDGRWLDTSDLTLRGVSPVHLTYLRNMKVTASASLAIIVDGALWGLISGHHYAGPKLLDGATERLAGLISDLVSMEVASIEEVSVALERERLGRHVTEVLAGVGAHESIIDGLVARTEALLGVADATGCTVRLGGRSRSVGAVPDGAVQDAVFGYLDAHRDDTSAGGTIQIEALAAVVPAAAGSERVAAGALALLLSREDGNWIVWFRPEVIETVTYSFRDDLDVENDGLNPDVSFAKYAASVRGRCEPWDEVGAVASELRSALGAIVIQQSERLARTSAALRSANLELDRFAYVAAHDLKEPLRGIHNYTDLLQEDFGEILAEQGDTYLEAMRRLADGMNSLVQSLLTYATVGRSDEPYQTVPLSSVVADAKEFVSSRLDERDATVTLHGDVEVFGDHLQLVQVFSNLLSNATKYTEVGVQPRIDINVTDLDRTDRGWRVWPQHNIDRPMPIVIAVSDNGIGVPDARREEIFEVFRRLHGREEFGGGSGAGLTIARRIAERHGGALWVEPNHPNGSKFLLALPVRDGGDPVPQLKAIPE